MEPDWTASYHDALDFSYRELQHIGGKTHASAEFGALAKVTQHLH